MSFCPICAQSNSSGGNICSKCGVSSVAKISNWLLIAGSQIHVSQLVASTIALAIIASLLFFKMPLLVQGLLLCAELGACVAVGRPAFIIRTVTRFEKSVMQSKIHMANGGRISRWFIRPAISFADFGSTIARELPDPAVKAAVQICLWLVFGSIALVVLIYIGFAIAVLVFSLVLVYFILRVLTSSNNSSDTFRPGAHFRIRKKQDGEHVEQDGVFFNEDRGRLQRRDRETLETTNILEPNIRVTEKKTFFGSPDPDVPYTIETEDGKRGSLKKVGWNEDLELELDDDRKE